METKPAKRIGVLTSGGDAPGMNAAIRAVVRTGVYYGCEVFGIEAGYTGLLSGAVSQLTVRGVSGSIGRGGTLLRTSRCKEFESPEGVRKGAEMMKVFGLDALVVIGGDGSFRGARDLAALGVTVMGIPGTIDNDIGCTDYTIGFDTALNTVRDAIDKIKDTAFSHERCSIIEVMGNHAGHIALECAMAGGAEVCRLPEEPTDIDADVIRPLLECRARGKRHFIIVTAEGVGQTQKIAERIKEACGITPTISVLGYIQRGGSPTVRDRVTASLMGVRAVEAILDGEESSIVASQKGEIVTIPIVQALAMTKKISEHDVLASKILAL